MLRGDSLAGTFDGRQLNGLTSVDNILKVYVATIQWQDIFGQLGLRDVLHVHTGVRLDRNDPHARQVSQGFSKRTPADAELLTQRPLSRQSLPNPVSARENQS